MALQHLELGKVAHGGIDRVEFARRSREVAGKVGKQIAKDYVVYPALTGPAFLATFTANLTANMIRNAWSNMVIFCGHLAARPTIGAGAHSDCRMAANRVARQCDHDVPRPGDAVTASSRLIQDVGLLSSGAAGLAQFGIPGGKSDHQLTRLAESPT